MSHNAIWSAMAHPFSLTMIQGKMSVRLALGLPYFLKKRTPCHSQI